MESKLSVVESDNFLPHLDPSDVQKQFLVEFEFGFAFSCCSEGWTYLTTFLLMF